MDLKSFTLSAQAIIHPFVRVGKFDTRSRSYTYTTFFPSSRDPNLLLSPPSRISNSRRLEGRKPGVRFPRPQRHSANAYSPPPQTSRPPDNPQLAFQTLPPSYLKKHIRLWELSSRYEREKRRGVSAREREMRVEKSSVEHWRQRGRGWR